MVSDTGSTLHVNDGTLLLIQRQERLTQLNI